jgi:hypothetical protein
MLPWISSSSSAAASENHDLQTLNAGGVHRLRCCQLVIANGSAYIWTGLQLKKKLI